MSVTLVTCRAALECATLGRDRLPSWHEDCSDLSSRVRYAHRHRRSFTDEEAGKDMSTIRAFIWGAAIGATLGLLFAPQRGEVTRAQLQERLEGLQNQAQQMLNNLPSSVSDAIESGRQAVNSTITSAQQSANQFASQAKQATNMAAQKAQEANTNAAQTSTH